MSILRGIKFSVGHINCDKLKQKQVAIIKTVIGGSRLSNDMKFSNYAVIEFAEDDIKHLFPIISEADEFNRIKTNCLVYDLLETDANRGDYDKAFIYQTNGCKTDGWFGYLLCNTKTGKHIHKYYIDRNEGELCRQLNKSFNILRFRKKYAPYV